MPTILLICTGNICRSPMAEGWWHRLLPDHHILSAGIFAADGMKPDPMAVQLMQEHGMDISQHRARILMSWMVHVADLIFTMEFQQLKYIKNKFPLCATKAQILGHLTNTEIPDPYQKNLTEFIKAFALIEQSVRQQAADLNKAKNIVVTT